MMDQRSWSYPDIDGLGATHTFGTSCTYRVSDSSLSTRHTDPSFVHSTTTSHTGLFQWAVGKSVVRASSLQLRPIWRKIVALDRPTRYAAWLNPIEPGSPVVVSDLLSGRVTTPLIIIRLGPESCTTGSYHADRYTTLWIRILFVLDDMPLYTGCLIELTTMPWHFIRLLIYWQRCSRDPHTQRLLNRQRVDLLQQEIWFPAIEFWTNWSRFICVQGHAGEWSSYNHEFYGDYHLLQHKVIATSGDEARKIFFNDSGLNSTEGGKLLRGGVSQVLELHRMLNSLLYADSIRKRCQARRRRKQFNPIQ